MLSFLDGIWSWWNDDQGECTGSICLAYGLESCQCRQGPDDKPTKVHIAIGIINIIFVITVIVIVMSIILLDFPRLLLTFYDPRLVNSVARRPEKINLASHHFRLIQDDFFPGVFFPHLFFFLTCFSPHVFFLCYIYWISFCVPPIKWIH